MTMQVTRLASVTGAESAYITLTDSGGERMFVDVDSFADFVQRAKAGEFDRKFEPTTGTFTDMAPNAATTNPIPPTGRAYGLFQFDPPGSGDYSARRGMAQGEHPPRSAAEDPGNG